MGSLQSSLRQPVASHRLP